MRGDDHQRIVDRRRAAGQPGAAPPGDERTGRDEPRYGTASATSPRAREAHDRGTAAGDTRVACAYRRELEGFGTRPVGSELRVQVGEERGSVSSMLRTL